VAVCHAVNPDVLVIGGGLMAAGDRLLQPLAEATQAELATGSGLVVQIRRSALGDDAALAGAGAFAAATGTAVALAGAAPGRPDPTTRR
jgi:glucokinase